MIRNPRCLFAAATLLCTAFAACRSGGDDTCVQDSSTANVELGTFPYHPVIYHLDLSILAYQIHGQSLVWPFDPFYAERSKVLESDRDDFMDKVRDWVQIRGPVQSQSGAGLDAYRGPGALTAFADNRDHDPVLYIYSRVHPWSDCVINGSGRWIEYLTPSAITGRIREVYVAYRPTGSAREDDVVVAPIPPARSDWDAGAADILLAFEGGTGGKGEPGRPASQSLMGFVLIRFHTNADYDVHICFRGSRSGSAVRATLKSVSTQEAKGSPDWITDLGLAKVDAAQISSIGKVARGFATSMNSILPKVFASLDTAAGLKGGRTPKNIYVTGHSLGGALAQHFTSAVLMGDRYGPGGTGARMPATLTGWPWRKLKLITFGAPRAGDAEWAETLTTQNLQSDFYSGALTPFDEDALMVTDANLVPRLLDPRRPAGYRILISSDPITTETAGGGAHVGKTVYVNSGCGDLQPGLANITSHEPEQIRNSMLESTADGRTPEVAWRYLDMKVLNPTRDDGAKGTRPEFMKLGDAVLRYYSDRRIWLDAAAFARDLDLLFAIEDGTAK